MWLGDSNLFTGVFSLASALVGGILVLLGQYYFARKQDKAVRDQIAFLLRSISTQMAMVRDYPKYYRLVAFDTDMQRLTERVLSTEGSVALNDGQRAAVLDAMSITEQAGRFIQSDYEILLTELEYMTAAARGAFTKLQAGRHSLGDQKELTRPGDPRQLHNWHPGDVIPGN